MRERALHDVEGREAGLWRRALRRLRDAFPGHRIVYAAGRRCAVDEGDPPEAWYAEPRAASAGGASSPGSTRAAPSRRAGRTPRDFRWLVGVCPETAVRLPATVSGAHGVAGLCHRRR